MSVWFCIPSARPAEEANLALEKWRAQGYKIALWRDTGDSPPINDMLLVGQYPGYARAVNALVAEVLRQDPECDWVVAGGDDTEPDPDEHAQQIAACCSAYFGGMKAYAEACFMMRDTLVTSTMGVMQPTGDRWAGGSIDRICGSPWMGREFCERAYGGSGPLWPEYAHMFVDSELQEVAIRLGCLWQRQDLTHMHHHWMRDGQGVDQNKTPPDFLRVANSREHWDTSERIFRSRKAAGFPGHEPISSSSANG